ncbi:MAG: AAA family ATPase [Clostridia bacterium]|nr:AAA family ATPase [Clostridia bacterium]
MEIKKIVITGGPCGGKSTAMTWIKSYFEERGWRVLFVPETATELITGGVAPWTCGKNVDHQKCQMKLQITKEEVFAYAASTMPCEKLLIVCDRGALDNRAYMNDEEYRESLAYIGKHEVELRDSYDAVFHLVTAALGAEKYYTTANNAARTETVEEAIALDNKIITAWTGHPHFRLIDNSTDFEGKMRRLLCEIASFLGEGEHYEIERKYLIAYPDIAWLEANPFCHRTEILQTYLVAQDGEEIRVRQRGEGGHYTYFKTVKRPISDVKRVEEETVISEREYLTLLLDADPALRPVRKTRYLLSYEGQYLEIDVYPFMPDTAIVEIELCSEDTPVILPPEFRLIREVTGDPQYKNRTLAAR